jgi:aminomethyltransferase
MGYGVVELRGTDRVEFLNNAVTNRVPAEDGRGTYALLLDPQGRVETDLYAYSAAERLLVFCPPAWAEPVAEDWRSKTFIQDVEVTVLTDRLAVFGVHGPRATEKVASVLNGASAPEPALTFVRGSMDEAGVTAIATDAPAGEEGYEIVCTADVAADAFDALINRGMNAVPFGYRTWETLTLEAGTPLFGTELEGEIPNVAGVRNALDFEKGCYVGQEVVSRVENQGRPSRRLVGLRPETVPEAGAAVFDGDEAVGEVTRGVHSPGREEPLALAYVDYTLEADDLAVRVDGEAVPADRAALPLVEGSVRSARLPRYPGD